MSSTARRRLTIESLETRRVLSASLPLNELDWSSLGPEPIRFGETPGSEDVAGRISALAAHPSDSNIIYAATAGGGVWKTIDGGTDWAPLTDNQASLFMGAIAVAQSDPNIVYAGTGDATNSEFSQYGRGLLKSIDGGASWTLLPGNTGLNEFNRRTIAQIVVHPADPNTVYAAVGDNGVNGLTGNTGIWKSTDGGTTWTNTTQAAGLTSEEVYSDLVMDPSAPDTLYAAIGSAAGSNSNGVYKTVDGGATWNPAGDFPLGATDANVGRIRIALAASSPGTLVASIANDSDVPSEAGDGSLYKLMKSEDSGITWNELPGVPNFLGDQGFYASSIFIAPNDPNAIYAAGAIGADSIIHSPDGGATWNDLAVGFDGDGPHADHHAFAYTAGGLVIEANAGGIWRLDSASPGAIQWTNLTGDLGIAQFTSIALHPTEANFAYGAAPDTGVSLFGDNLKWEHIGGGRPGTVRVDRNNPNTVYRTLEFGGNFIERSDSSGALWTAKTNGINVAEPANTYVPLVVDPTITTRLLTGTDRVYESVNRADSWTAISSPLTNGWTSTSPIDAIAAAPNDVNTIYASADGNIFVTTNRGATWAQRDLPIAGEIRDMIVDPTNAQTVWAIRGEFTGGHVWKSIDGGVTWTDLSGNLPDVPVHSIELDTRPIIDRLYIGTDEGVYATNGISGQWTRFGDGLPNTQVSDLELNPTLNILAAGSLGRGMWQMLATPGADTFEPNQNRVNARELGVVPGVHLRDVSLHQIGTMMDEDWYRVELLRGDDLDFSISFARALADFDLEVTDADGNSLGSAATGTDDQETVSLVGLAPGTYYIHVTGNGPTHYDLSVEPGIGSTTRIIYVNDLTTTNDVYSTAPGDDSNDGLSPGRPKASLQSVLTDLDLSGSDYVVLDTGTYSTGATIQAEDEGAVYAGSRFGTNFESNLIAIEDADFNLFYLIQFAGGGFYAHGDGINDSTNNIFRRNQFTDSSPAIQIDHGNADLIVDNAIDGTGFYGMYFPSGGSVALRGNTISSRTNGVFVSGGATLTVATGNLFADNVEGIYAADGTIDVSGSAFAGNERGVFISPFVTSASISNNDFDANAIGVRSEALVTQVFNNQIHDSSEAGLSGLGIFGGASWDAGQPNTLYENAIGIQADSGSTVRFNELHHNDVGIRIIGGPFLSQIDIYNNLIYRNTSRGIHISGAIDVQILHNTIYANDVNADAIRIDGGSQDIVHKNNILWVEDGYDLWVDTDSQQGFVSDFNNLYKTGNGKLVYWQKDFWDLFDWQTEANYDSDSIGYTILDPTLDDPAFVNLAADDYHLVDTVSTSIDAADPTSSSVLEPLPNGGRANLGAYGNTTQAALSRPAYIEVDFPNYYTDWEEAESGFILWHAVNVTGAVDIELYTDTGTFLSHIATTDVSTGVIGWSPSTSNINGDITSRYRIRITSQSNTTVSDQSREPFSVPPANHDFTGDNNDDFYVNDGGLVNDEFTTAVGNNRNTGTSPDDPKAVLLAMLRAYDLGPGTTVRIDTGDYIHVRNVVISGNTNVGDDEGLTITGPTDPARIAHINRANPFTGSTNLELDDGDFVTLRNLSFSGANRGVWVHNGSTNLLAQNLTFSNNTSDGLLVEYDAESSSFDRLTAAGNGGHGIAIHAFISSLSNSTAHHNTGTGILLNTFGDTRLENNEVHDNGTGISVSNNASGSPTMIGNADLTLGAGNRVYSNTVGIEASSNVLVAGNTVYDNAGNGLQLYGASAQRNVVFNNAAGIVQMSACAPSDVVENRVYHNTNGGIVVMGSSQARNNVVYSNAVGISGTVGACILSTIPFSGEIKNNIAYSNSVAAVELIGAQAAAVVNNTIYQPAGTGISVHGSSQNASLTNNAVWIEEGHGILVDNDSQSGFASDYNDLFVTGSGHVGRWQTVDRTVLSAWRGATFTDQNSLARDPLFVDIDGPDNVLGWVGGVNGGNDDDFHPSSLYGSFHNGSLAPIVTGSGLPLFPVAAETVDAAQSPLIDRGDASSSFANEPTPNGNYINIGAFGNTEQASKSPAEYTLVLRPDGGEPWPQRQEFSIHWRSHDSSSAVDIDLMQDGNPVPLLAIADDTDNDGEFSWTVPETLTPASNYRIRVTRVDSGVEDLSDGPFTITAPITVYYVNDSTVLPNDWTLAAGDDGNDGFSPLTPKATIRSVLESYDLGPGDVIRVDNGDYNLTVNIPLTDNDSGVKIEGFNDSLLPARRALLDRGNPNPGSFVFSLEGADDITIDNLYMTGAFGGVSVADQADSDGIVISNNTVVGMASYGISIAGTNDAAQIEANRVSDTDTGIVVVRNDAVVERNQVFKSNTGIELSGGPVGLGNVAHDNLLGFSVSDGSRLEDNNEAYDNDTGIYTANALVTDSIVHDNRIGIMSEACVANNTFITANYVYHNSEIGILAHSDSEVRNNVVHGNPVGIKGEGSVCTSVHFFSGQIVNNLVYANSDWGVLLTQAFDATVENNTIYQPSGNGIQVQGSSQNVTLRNNNVWSEAGFAIAVASDSESGFSSDYNNLYTTGAGKVAQWEDTTFTGLSEWFYEVGVDHHSISADPQFMDRNGADNLLGFVDGRLTASYFNNPDLTGTPVLSRFEPTISVDWADTAPVTGLPDDGFSVRWEGFIHIPSTGDYTFYSLANDGERLFLDGNAVIDQWEPANSIEHEFTAVGLTAGWHSIRYEVYDDTGSAGATLSWSTASTLKRAIPARFFSNDPVTFIPGDYGADDNFAEQPGSPIIDAGDPSSGYIHEPEPNGRRVNLGYTGNRNSAQPSSAQSLEVLSPTGFEKFELNQAVEIQWRSAGLLPTELYSDEVLADAPLAYYRLDEASGILAADSSGNNSNAAYVDDPTLNQSSATFDPTNRSVRLNGVSGHVALPSGFADFSSGLTLEVWVYPTDRLESQPFIELSDGSAANAISLGATSSPGTLDFLGVLFENAVELNRWQHFAGVMDSAGNVSVYKNGQLLGTATASLPPVVTRDRNFLGRSGFASNPIFSGFLDEAAIYAEPLSAGQINAHFSAGITAGVVDLALVRWGDGSFVTDIANDIFNDGSYLWTVPANVPLGTDYAIRVRSGTASTPTAQSNQAFSIASNGTNYYVNDAATTGDVVTTAIGSNSNDGKSPGNPMSSLHALINAYDLDAGDVIHLDTGDYRIYREIVLGSSDSGATVTGPATAVARLQRGNQNTDRYTFELAGAEDVVLDHLTISGAYGGIHAIPNTGSSGFELSNSELMDLSAFGVRIDSSSINTTLTNNKIHDITGVGLSIDSANSLIDGNTIWRTSSGVELAGDNGVVSNNRIFANSTGISAINQDEALTRVVENIVYENSNGIVAANQTLVRGNSVYGNTSSGILVSGSAIADANSVWDNLDGIVGTQDSSCDAVVSNNRVYHNQNRGIALIGFGVARDNVVYDNSIGISGERCHAFTGFLGQISNNLIYDNTNQGIVISGGQTGGTVANNTVVQPIGDAVRIQDSTSGVSLRNNILTNNAGFNIAVTADSTLDFSSDYNDLHATGTGKIGRWEDIEFTTRADWAMELGVDQHSISADPTFVDIGGADDILGYSENPIGLATIIDNGDPGFSITGTWSSSSNGFNSDATDTPAGNGDSIATWTFVGLTAGDTYQIAATWAPDLTLAGNVEYEVIDGANVVALHEVRQFVQPGSFNVQGTYWEILSFTKIAGNSLTVRLDNRTGGSGVVRADAIRLQRIQGDRGADDNFHVLDTSPTIDAGDPAEYYLSEPQANGERLNQGFDGNRPSATTTVPRVQLLSPNGFEKLEVGQETTISWRESGIRAERLVALINSGGVSVDNWLTDQYFLDPGSPGSISDLVDTGAISNPAPQDVYQSFMSAFDSAGNALTYQLPVPDGDYTIRLHFVEPNGVAGDRVFDIFSQESLVFDNFDIAADAGGQLRATTKTLFATASGGTGLNIALVNETDMPALLAAVEVTTRSTGLPAASVDLELSLDNGSTWTEIASNLTMDRFGRGSFEWVAGPASSTALMRVTANEGGSPSDHSDNPFMIIQPGNHYYLNDASLVGDVFTTAVGNNLNDGKSPATPMYSLGALLAAYDFEPGDIIHVDNGTYRLVREADFYSDDSGVRVEGPSTGAAVLDRGNPSSGPAVLRLSGADDVTIDRLVLTGAQVGIWAAAGADSDRVTITKTEIHHFGTAGILIEESNDSSDVTHNVVRNSGTGIDIRGAGALLRHNQAFDNSTAISATGPDGLLDENEAFNNVTGISVVNIQGVATTNVLRNVVHHNQTGLFAHGDVVVSDNTVTNNNFVGIQVKDAQATRNLISANQIGIQAEGCGSNQLVSHNRVWNNAAIGLSVTSQGSTIGNHVYDNSVGISVASCNFSSLPSGAIANNLVYDNSNVGILISQTFAPLQLVNNTVYQPVGDAVRIGMQSQDVALLNNILLIDAGYDIFVSPNSQTGFVSDYNLLHQSADPNAHVGFFNGTNQDGLVDWQLATAQDAHAIASDPQFVDMNGADNVLGYTTAGLGFDGGLDDNFHLHRNSPAIDAAQVWYAPVTDREIFERSDDPGTVNTGSKDYAESSLGVSLFADAGDARTFHAENSALGVDMPIAFPFYGKVFTKVFVSTKGFLYFDAGLILPDGNNSDAGLRTREMIAPLWDDLDTVHEDDDVFVDTSTAGQITIRWDATLIVDESDIQMAVTLFDDGRIRFDYGPGNSNLTPTIGISRGDNQSFILSSYNNVDDLSFAPSLEFALAPNLTFADLGAHEFQGDSNDSVPPTVLSTLVESHVAVNGTRFTHIHVSFSEPVDAIDANAPANYDFREAGPDGLFDSPDDVLYGLIPHYTFGAVQATVDVVVTGGVLPSGNYRLRISGNTSIHDLAGNKLDGDNDGIDGGDSISANQSPVLTAIANRTTDEGQVISFAAVANDLDAAQTLTYTLNSDAPPGATIDPSTGAFSWTPAEGQDGQFLIAVRVTDNGSPQLTDMKLFTATVNELNDAPLLSDPGDPSINERSDLNFVLNAADADVVSAVPDTLTYSLVSGDTLGMTLDANTGAFHWTPTEGQDGTYVVVFGVKDNHNAAGANQTITINVTEINEAPTLANPGNKSIDEKAALAFSLTATDSDVAAGIADTVSYSIHSGSLTGMSLNGSTGAFSWTPTEAQDGQHVIVLRAKDNHDLAGTDQTITISVNEVNDAPVLVNPGNKSLNEESALTFTLSAIDADIVAGVADSLTYSITAGALAGMSLNGSSGAFSWTPSESQDGVHVVVFRVIDNHNAAGSDQTVTITVSEVNEAPELVNPANITVGEKAAVTFSLSATDDDVVAGAADTIEYTIASGSVAGMTLVSTSGAFSWNPTEAQDGQHVVVFRAKDNHGLAGVDQTITISVSEINDPPLLANPGNKTISEKTSLTFSVNATDSDIASGIADTVVYSLASGDLTGMTLDGNTGAFSWTPTESQDGQHVVVFRATDSQGSAGIDQTITLTVSEVNDPPVLASPGNKSLDELSSLSISLNASDDDIAGGVADTVTYSIASGNAAGMTLNASTGAFSWTPSEAQDGIHVIVFRAVDNHDLASINQAVTVTVNDVNDPPVLASPGDKTIDENVELSFSLAATDADMVAGTADTISYSIVSGSVTGMSLSSSTGVFLWTPAENQDGQYVLVFRATDNHDAAGADQTVTITVQDGNDAPTAIAITGVSLKENISGATVGTLSATDPDAGQTHTFTTADSRFEINGSTLKLKAGEFVTGATVSVDVTATDSGSPSQSTTRTLVINVIANPRSWLNSVQKFDTNADGSVVPLDALRIINQLNEPTILESNGKLPDLRSADSTLPFYDVNGDGFCTTNDVLQIINFLNSLLGEGEARPEVDYAQYQYLIAVPYQRLSVQHAEEEGGVRSADVPTAVVNFQSVPQTQLVHSLPVILATNPSDELESILDEIAEDVFDGWLTGT